MDWFDGHLDLACLEINKREMTKPLDALDEDEQGPWPPVGVTLPELASGNVRGALATIFTEAGGDGPEGYRPGDPTSANDAGCSQVNVYRRWADDGHIEIAEFADFSGRKPGVPMLGLLLEGADPVTDPNELPWWQEQGVVAVSLTWAMGSRYAGGNGRQTCDEGLTGLGRDMVQAMDSLHLVHDLTHLSQPAVDDLLELTRAPVIASHSNCRALLGGEQNPDAHRHLADETIVEIGKRGGVIGVVLYGPFVTYNNESPANIDDLVEHIEHICELTNSRKHVGLGSDMDGGFSADKLIEGVRRPRDFTAITDALAARGWSDTDLAAFAGKNWLSFWERIGAYHKF